MAARRARVRRRLRTGIMKFSNFTGQPSAVIACSGSDKVVVVVVIRWVFGAGPMVPVDVGQFLKARRSHKFLFAKLWRIE